MVGAVAAPLGTAHPVQSLYRRLFRSLERVPERLLFRAYCARYGQADAEQLPALIPQVYLHFAPYTKRELKTMEGASWSASAWASCCCSPTVEES